MSVQMEGTESNGQSHMSMYRKQAEFEDYYDQMASEDGGNLVKGILSGLAIMLPFYTILAGLLLLLKNH